MQDPSLQYTDFVVMAQGLSFSLACGILVPRLGIKLASSAFQGRFLITGPPGKSPTMIFLKYILQIRRLMLREIKQLPPGHTAY